MTPHIQHQRLARKSAVAELWADLEAEEERARSNHKSPDWRKVLRTKIMREDAATTVFGKEQ